MSVLTALHYEGAEAKSVALLTAGKNFLLAQAVAVAAFIAFSYSAVLAVVFTDVTDFDKTADKNRVAVIFFTQSYRFLLQNEGSFLITEIDESLVFLFGKGVSVNELCYNITYMLIHLKSHPNKLF